jgi:hypothetical protein
VCEDCMNGIEAEPPGEVWWCWKCQETSKECSICQDSKTVDEFLQCRTCVVTAHIGCCGDLGNSIWECRDCLYRVCFQTKQEYPLRCLSCEEFVHLESRSEIQIFPVWS